MKRISYIFSAFLLLFVVSSCTTGRWTVKNKSAVDQSDYEILEQHQFLKISGDVSPEAPVLQLDVLSRTKYRYAQKVLVQRNIQDYKLRPWFTALGLAGAATAFFVANATIFRGNRTPTKSLTLNAAGALLAVSGIFNMKPVGEPRPTGEERFLRQTGTVVKVDTVNVQEPVVNTASIRIHYQDQVLFDDAKHSFSSGRLEIPLADKLRSLQIKGPNPGSVSVKVEFIDSSYSFKFPVEKILQPYAQVSSQFTELRNSPNITPNNILADLLQGSQVRVQDYSNEQWYRVLYGGISENYIYKDDAVLVWRPSDFAQDNQVVTVPRISFGNVDVESNIPVLEASNPNGIALIVTNEDYNGNLPENRYAFRDGRLIRTYLENALGFHPQNIFTLTDISDSTRLYRTLSHIQFAADDSTEFFVYLNGYGSVARGEAGARFTFLTVDENGKESQAGLNLKILFEQLSAVPSLQTLVVSDIDFSHNMPENAFTINEQQRALESLASALTEDQPKTSLLMGTQLGQPSSLYVSSTGEDKKHHIFPYFFARAIQQRRTNLSAIYQYLERNVSYTSRKLHDRPQDPRLFGDVFLDLVNE
ncbi:MAG TPA: caspase family protein [Balneolaceae bacterium]|nr:caspase family protein [Balneolaceae bacterium]